MGFFVFFWGGKNPKKPGWVGLFKKKVGFLPTLMLVKLFSVYAVVPIIVLFWGVSEFQVTYHGSLYLSFLSLWILIFAGARKTQEDTL